MQMHRCERSRFHRFLIAALLLTKNVAPQLGTGVGSDVATCSASFSRVAFLDVGFNSRSYGRSRARRLRRGFVLARATASRAVLTACSKVRIPAAGLSLMSLATPI